MKLKGFRYRHRPVTVLRSFLYHGFTIEVLNNNADHPFRYEWRITPPKNTPIHLRRFKIPFTDPTSHRRRERASMNAKEAVNELRTPRWNIL